jgi:hypothetical protein
MDPRLIVAVTLAVFAVTNGRHDASNAIATLRGRQGKLSALTLHLELREAMPRLTRGWACRDRRSEP